MFVVTSKIAIPWEEFSISYARSSGPGGQNVNKTSSKAILHWDISHSPSLPEDVRQRFLKTFAAKLTSDGGIVIASDENRAQEANERRCFEKLKEWLLAVAVPPKIRRPTKPTRSSQRARIQNKIARGAVKQGRRRVDHD